MAERWLVIDDSSTIQRVIKLAFQAYDVVIIEADSCQEAAREMAKQTPSLVIADAALGGVQGVPDFLALQAQSPEAPFIILEGSYDNIDEAQFKAAGFRHFLKKPFDGSQLLSITRQALGRALPYRGEAAAAGASPSGSPANSYKPPPPPPMRSTRAPGSDPDSSFPVEPTGTGFDLGLHDSRTNPDSRAAIPDNRAALAATQPPMDSKTLAQTIASEVRNLVHNQSMPETRPPSSAQAGLGMTTMSLSGNFGRKEIGIQDSSRNPLSFSLEDEEPSKGSVSAPASWDTQRGPETKQHGWEGPRPAGSHLSNILEPLLQEEMEKLVHVAVEDYCRKHFAGIARELIQRELDKLTQDRSRLLMD